MKIYCVIVQKIFAEGITLEKKRRYILNHLYPCSLQQFIIAKNALKTFIILTATIYQAHSWRFDQSRLTERHKSAGISLG